jgi:hypothetical protein
MIFIIYLGYNSAYLVLHRVITDIARENNKY